MKQLIKTFLRQFFIGLWLVTTLGIASISAAPMISQQAISKVAVTQNITIPIETVLETDSESLTGMYTMTIELWSNYANIATRKRLWLTSQDVFFKNGVFTISASNN